MKKNNISCYAILAISLAFAGCARNISPTNPAAGAYWRFTGGTAGISAGEADYTSLCIYNGTPYLAYADAASNSVATVMSYTNNAWNRYTTAQTGAFRTWLTFNSSGVMYLVYGTLNSNIYFTYNNGTAGYGGINIANNILSTCVSNDVVYSAFADASSNSKLTVYSFVYSGGISRATIGNADFAGPVYKTLSIYTDGTTPYVAFADAGANSKLSVMKYSAGNWAYVGGQGFSTADVDAVSLYVYSGVPYVAFRDNYNGGYTSVMFYSAPNWVYLGSLGFSPGTADSNVLKFFNGHPYIAFKDYANSGRVSVMTYDGIVWTGVGSYGFSPGPAKYISMDMYDNMPCVAFSDGANSNKAYMMYYR